MREGAYAVWLRDCHVGMLHQRGDHTRLVFDVTYREDPDRPVLGLHFEEQLLTPQASTLRLPPWFSNLLPEGRIRNWIAEDRGVSVDREMELLAHTGHDLPGAVRVLLADGPTPTETWSMPEARDDYRTLLTGQHHPGWRISLAGVQLKFGVLSVNDRLTVPGFGEGSDWIVKLPDHQFENLPRNEFSMMSWAAVAGIDVPTVRLIHRDQLNGLPPNVWPGGERWAYAVKRFDRDQGRRLVHVEDLAQVRNFYPEGKYRGNFETVASLIYRNHDVAALREFARRLTFIILIGNGDAHLKNWSLIYRNPRIPTLAPAYDLVSTAIYRAYPDDEDLGLKFGGSRSFERVSLSTFQRLEERLGATDAGLVEVVKETISRTKLGWEECAGLLDGMPVLQRYLEQRLASRSCSLLRY